MQYYSLFTRSLFTRTSIQAFNVIRILLCIFVVSSADKTTNACVHEFYYVHLQLPFITCNFAVILLEVSLREQSFWHSTFHLVVFHILLRRLPLQKRVTLRKIGGHVVFANSQSGSFRIVIPQSILRITQFRKV